MVDLPSKKMLAVAASDHAIYLLQEQLSSGGQHRSYKRLGAMIVNHRVAAVAVAS